MKKTFEIEWSWFDYDLKPNVIHLALIKLFDWSACDFTVTELITGEKGGFDDPLKDRKRRSK